MKRIATIIAFLTASLLMQAQTNGDFFSFVDSFDWKQTKTEFKAKNADRILPESDSLVISAKMPEDAFFLRDMKVGEYDFVTIVWYMADIPFVIAMPAQSVLDKYLPSLLSAKLDRIASETLGSPDSSMQDIDLATKGFEWLGNATGTFRTWSADHYSFVSFSSRTDDGLSYMFVASSIMNSLNSDKPAIQDTFFGIKIGSHLTSSQVKSAVGARGVFRKETRESNTISYLFADIYYAGSKWDFANFICSGTGTFYWFNAYNSFDDSGRDNEKEAKSLYEDMKEKLDKKYGEGEEEKDSDGNLCTTYFGSNGIAIMLSHERSKSLGGSYRRYVEVEYIDVATYQKQNQADNDEL